MSAEQAEHVLEVDSLSVEFSTPAGPLQALRDVSLSIAEGETLGVAGESGSGKSTLALAILQYLDSNGRITAGDIMFDGSSLRFRSARELRQIRGQRIAHVPQNPEKSLNPSIRVGEQIAETIQLHQDLPNQEVSEKVTAILEEVGITDPEYNADRYPHELSGGMQQRILIAMALSCNPDLLILDEPTTGLDVTTQANIMDLIADLKARRNTSILLITHDLGVIAETADRVCILYAGEVMERGTTRTVFEAPSNPYTRGLLAARPSLDETSITGIPGGLPDLHDIPSGCIFADRCEFSTDACTKDPIPEMEVSSDQSSRCLHWETVRDTPLEATTTEQRDYEPGDTLLEVNALKKFFGDESFLDRIFGSEPPVKAVNGIDLKIRESETLGLVGESGSGKSTLGRTIIRLLEPEFGEIKFRGRDITEIDQAALRAFRAECQVVFQNPDTSLNPRKTVYQILHRPIDLFTDLEGDAIDQRIIELLEDVNLSREYAFRYPHQLSGGEKQRVSIARAFAANPSFVVLDEPVTALDVSVQASILELLARLRDEYDASYLFISHDLSVVNHICDRVAVMYLGKIVEVGTTAEIFNPPHHPYTQALLSSVPSIESSETDDRVLLEGSVPSAREPPAGCPFQTRCPKKIGDVCEEEHPPLEAVGDGTGSHMIACHLSEEEMRDAVSSAQSPN